MRKFLVFLSVVLIVVCCALPAFADEVEREEFTLHIVDGVAIKENFVDGMYYVKVYNNNTLRADLGKVNLYYGSSYHNEVQIFGDANPPHYLDIAVTSEQGSPPTLSCSIKDVNSMFFFKDRTYVTFEPAPDDPPTQSVFGVFTSIGDWLTESLSSLGSLFYNDSGLTFLGVLAVAGLAISVIFFLIGIIYNFVMFGG